MIRFSEYVSLGHPDKIADYISQYLLDRYIERDPKTRYAVEVQIKGNRVTMGGEVTSEAQFSMKEVAKFVRQAVNDIGYTKEYQSKWGAQNTICGEDIRFEANITQQSPDIAQGLSGWGDQGIFFGMARYNPTTCLMPEDHALAKLLCKKLFESNIGGLDIKTQVVMEEDRLAKVIVAIPLLSNGDKEAVESLVYKVLPKQKYDLIINGTGKYVQHSTVADCGTTGRKLAVDFYGGNCMIGGGSPWTKDGSKADLTLNLVARKLAKNYSLENKCDVFVRLACCIGRKEVDFCAEDAAGNVIEYGCMELDPAKLRHEYRLDTPIYASMCKWGLFGEFQLDKMWE